MKLSLSSLTLIALGIAANAAAYDIHFQNNCAYTVWPAVGKAPNGQVDPSVSFGAKVAKGGSASFTVTQTELGIRAWGRTGCDANGGTCKTGRCNGGLKCTDGGITAAVLYSEFGYANFGAQYGGERTSWDLSRVSAQVNIPTKLASSDGQSVTCADASCAANQAYNSPTDYAADRNSPLTADYTVTFCP